MVGSDVKDLQVFLNSLGFLISQTGPGSPGDETEFFGERTRDALSRFQEANDILPARGYFGPKTREYVVKTIGQVDEVYPLIVPEPDYEQLSMGSQEDGVVVAEIDPLDSDEFDAPTEDAPAFLTRSLVFGDADIEVITLQRLLNKDPYTRLAKIGTGSPGNESEYFGQLTLDSVKRFQIKYHITSRVEDGLGRVGPKTKEKLNSL
jgi:peptidoglycan hydrolase-like protein with peptidoglycan-binding domain